MSKSFFNSLQGNKVNSPEQLNDYIKTSTPGAWLTVTAIIILLCSVLVWAAFGSLNTTVELKGVADNGRIICFTDDASRIKAGNPASAEGCNGTVISVSEKPISREDAAAEINADEYTLYCLELSDWNYVVELDIQEGAPEGIVNAAIVTESIRPVSFVFN